MYIPMETLTMTSVTYGRCLDDALIFNLSTIGKSRTELLVKTAQKKEENKMKIMIAFGIPPSGKKAQVLRRTLMPDGNEAELIEKYAECITEIMCARNVHVIVKET